MVDYKQNGVDMHQVIEIRSAESMGTVRIIKLLQQVVGNSVVSCIVELFTDMSCNEIEKISQSPAAGMIKWCPIYITTDIALV